MSIKESLKTTYLDSFPDAVIIIDMDLKISYINPKGTKLLNINKKEVIGKNCSEALKFTLCQPLFPLKNRKYHQITNKNCYLVDSKGYKTPISLSTSELKDRAGKTIGIIESIRDLRNNNLDIKEKRGLITSNYSSRSLSMKRIFDILPAISKSDSTLLILGETGTGKGYLAKAVHNLGDRYLEPFTTLNCSAIPESLIESELFGYTKGAFTGALNNKQGFLETAGKGTVFLDEIGDLPFTVQTKLLRLLQEKVYEPVGSTKTRKCEARIITATNKNLEEMVNKGVFRKDLYYRLNVVTIKLPELKERKEDIIPLAETFISKFNKSKKDKIIGLDEDVIKKFLDYPWPGNIRELENTIERAFIFCKNSVINFDALPENFKTLKSETTKETKSIKENEIIYINTLLEKYDYNYSLVAKKLGIHRTTLYRKLKKSTADVAKVQH